MDATPRYGVALEVVTSQIGVTGCAVTVSPSRGQLPGDSAASIYALGREGDQAVIDGHGSYDLHQGDRDDVVNTITRTWGESVMGSRSGCGRVSQSRCGGGASYV